MAYETLVQTLIPNTTMQKYINNNGVHISYRITPDDGYVLHDNGLDEEIINDMTLMPAGEIKLGYRPSTASCGANYNFSTTQVKSVNGKTVDAYGLREFYAILKSEVPTDQVFGGDSDNNHEIKK